jgi:murein DD-endopeptidase MepM/ murein hydrolase activator NlpD
MSITVLPRLLAQTVGRLLCPKNRSSVSKRDTRTGCLWCLLALLVFFAAVSSADEAAGKGSDHETLIRILTEREGTLTHLYVENLQYADVTVTLEMDLVNMKASVNFPCTQTVPGKKKVEFLTLTPRDSAQGWSWTYTYYSTFGNTSAQHDDSYIYSLPYTQGKTYRVSQGYNGSYSHFGADQFAIDWRMPLGTPVHAARGGVVVGVKEDSNVGGDSAKYDWDANYVLIRHADGTLGQYVHLKKGGAIVGIGAQVQAGDLIGYSGNTGHSTGPHLHFSVFKASDGKHRETIPVKFKTADDFAVTLEEGRNYKASGSPTYVAGNNTLESRHSVRQDLLGLHRSGESEPVGGPVPAAVGH